MNKPVIISEEAGVAPVAVTANGQGTVGPAYIVLGGISFSHFLNDTMQSLIPSVYPILKQNYALDFAQIGLITLVFQLTASLLQPVVGMITDRKAMPYSLAAGMGFTFFGLILLGFGHSYFLILIAAALVGLGSSVFHPESARIARLASGGHHGFAQSVFQVGGNFGTSLGPVLAALIVLPFGQPSLAWFSAIAFLAIVILLRIGKWYKPRFGLLDPEQFPQGADAPSPRRVAVALGVLVLLVFSKFFYMASLTSYYTFYLIHKFGVPTRSAQLYLFLFLGAVAAGTFFGGPIGDRIGRRYVIWASILGALPFTLMLPHAGLTGSAVLSMIIGFIIASAMPAIVVYAQELMPHRFGMISGLFFGFAFGAAGIGAAIFGEVADRMGIDFVYSICAYLPAIGLLAVFLPHLKPVAQRH